jgi:ribosome-binding protein aMBF1 (putative translation factor)
VRSRKLHKHLAIIAERRKGAFKAVETIRSKRHRALVEAIMTERKKAGIRQVQLAKRLRRSQTWVARIESGERRIDVIEFLALAEAIGFNPTKIIELLLREK